MSYKVAVVGATGNVGREILEILSERRFPVREVVALASRRIRILRCSRPVRQFPRNSHLKQLRLVAW